LFFFRITGGVAPSYYQRPFHDSPFLIFLSGPVMKELSGYGKPLRAGWRGLAAGSSRFCLNRSLIKRELRDSAHSSRKNAARSLL
jgi:hypothetical protein